MIELGLSQARKQESMIRLILDVFSKEIESMQSFETEAATAPDLIECVHAACTAVQDPAYQTKGVQLRFGLARPGSDQGRRQRRSGSSACSPTCWRTPCATARLDRP